MTTQSAPFPAAVAAPALPAEIPAQCFINRELSHVEFNRRVLHQACDSRQPLLERLRFLAIACANLDEFFEVRVASLRSSLGTPGADGMPADEVYRQIQAAAHVLATQATHTATELFGALRAEGIDLAWPQTWTATQRRAVRRMGKARLLPLLTPVVLDATHPFPRIATKTINLAVELEGIDPFQPDAGVTYRWAVVQLPRSIARIMPLEGAAKQTFVWAPHVVQAILGELFVGMRVRSAVPFRLTRGSDLAVDLQPNTDLAQLLSSQLPVRHLGNAVRLEVDHNAPQPLIDLLLGTFRLGVTDLYRVNGLLGMAALGTLVDLISRPDLRYRPHTPRPVLQHEVPRGMFARLRKDDMLLHHPYDSFAPIVELLREAVADPAVLSIKQTLYRTDSQSPIVEALEKAARAGKDVTAVIELRARFDEAANIAHAKRLQRAGARVVYGVTEHKTHCKMLLIVRREGQSLRSYAHLGTGNYNGQTARVYTDLSLLTSNRHITHDVQSLFMQLTGAGRLRPLRRLMVAPFNLHTRLLQLIEFETAEARAGRPACIAARMNSLTDTSVCAALVRASQAGVKITLVVRGTCILRPGVAGYTETIQVRSVVGRFLEHSRVFYFYGAGKEHLFACSADWMQRNFFRRVEVAFPIEGAAQRRRAMHETLQLYLEDTACSWLLQADGTYTPPVAGPAKGKNAQQTLLSPMKLSANAGARPGSLSDLLPARDRPA